MTDAKTYQNAYTTVVGDISWHWKPELKTLTSSVVIVNDEPVIQVSATNKKVVHPRANKIYTLEELWDVQSGFLVDAHGNTKDLFHEIIKRRGEYGQKIILEVWAEQGYAARDFVREDLPISESPLLRKLIPSPKIRNKSKNSQATYTGILSFMNRGADSFWALTIKESQTILSQVQWNDYVGLADLARNVLDEEYVGVLLNIGKPEDSQALLNRKIKIDQNKISRSYFKDALLSDKQRKNILEISEKYHKDLGKVIIDSYGNYNRGKPAGEKAYAMALYPLDRKGVSIHKDKDTSIIAHRLFFELYNHGGRYEQDPDEISDAIMKEDTALWESYKYELHQVGCQIIEASLTPGSVQRSTGSGNGNLAWRFHALEVFVNREKYNEYLSNNSDDYTLYLYAQGKLQEA